VAPLLAQVAHSGRGFDRHVDWINVAQQYSRG
jgi:hypothetical protein